MDRSPLISRQFESPRPLHARADSMPLSLSRTSDNIQSRSQKNGQNDSLGANSKAENDIIDVNVQVAVIRRWWDSLGTNKLSTMKSLKEVTDMFIKMKIFADQLSATNYFIKMTGLPKKTLEKHGMEFNDFLSIFLKGILKQVVTHVFETVKDFKRKDAWGSWVPQTSSKFLDEASLKSFEFEGAAQNSKITANSPQKQQTQA